MSSRPNRKRARRAAIDAKHEQFNRTMSENGWRVINRVPSGITLGVLVQERPEVRRYEGATLMLGSEVLAEDVDVEFEAPR